MARQLSKISPGHITAQQELYPTLACESSALQQAAYGLLHQQIPSSQEQVSLEAALSKTYIAKLPEELLSLILAAPSLESVATANLQRGIPFPLRTYLLSWSLLFDHWTNASYKVQTDYAVSLKEGTFLKDFLDFTFQYLITGRPRPVDASRFDIVSYTPDMEDSPEKDTQWMLVHLYYLCLKHLPSLSKIWWRDECQRHLQRPVEAWTEKYVSFVTVLPRKRPTWDFWLTSMFRYLSSSSKLNFQPSYPGYPLKNLMINPLKLRSLLKLAKSPPPIRSMIRPCLSSSAYQLITHYILSQWRVFIASE